MSQRPEPPSWLADVRAVLAEGREPATVAAWTRRMDDALDRWGGRVPFQVVYDWHARAVGATPPGAAVRALGRRYTRALAGDRVGAHEWRDALRPVLRGLYRASYPCAEARQVGHALAHAYASANGYGPGEAAEFADHYADLSTGANARAYADANAIANADALARALAGADDAAYAGTYPGALVRAYVLAQVYRDGVTDPARASWTAYGWLADALAESLDSVGRGPAARDSGPGASRSGQLLWTRRPSEVAQWS